MYLDNILTRLELMHDEISGLTAHKEPPRLFATGAFPACYAVSRGFQETLSSEEESIFTYNVQIEVLVQPFKQDQVTAASTSAGTQAVHQWIETISTHYNSHRMMTTAALAPLAFLLHPGISFNSAGLVFPMTGSDGNLYFGTTFELLIPMGTLYTSDF